MSFISSEIFSIFNFSFLGIFFILSAIMICAFLKSFCISAFYKSLYVVKIVYYQSEFFILRFLYFIFNLTLKQVFFLNMPSSIFSDLFETSIKVWRKVEDYTQLNISSKFSRNKIVIRTWTEEDIKLNHSIYKFHYNF